MTDGENYGWQRPGPLPEEHGCKQSSRIKQSRLLELCFSFCPSTRAYNLGCKRLEKWKACKDQLLLLEICEICLKTDAAVFFLIGGMHQNTKGYDGTSICHELVFNILATSKSQRQVRFVIQKIEKTDKNAGRGQTP
jgi:hypothetical protein